MISTAQVDNILVDICAVFVLEDVRGGRTQFTDQEKSMLKPGRKLIQIMLVLAFIFSLSGSAAIQASTPSTNLQPSLYAKAAVDPDQFVSVIVQKNASSGLLEAQVAHLGGVVTRDLHIINAFSANLQAGKVLDLAKVPGARWISLDAPVATTASDEVDYVGESTLPPTFYLDTLKVRPVWEMGDRGQGIAVAEIDSGVAKVKDFQLDPTTGKPDSRVIERLSFNFKALADGDLYGHGTHVAGIIGGNGYESGYLYQGIAPGVNLISLRVNDDTGMAYESDIVAALQWVYDHKQAYNIRVVNLSMNSPVPSSYHTSPLSAAAEILWFNGVVVVVSAGNSSSDPAYNPINAAPAHDPFLITVGAVDEKGTANREDDSVSNFSAAGTTIDGYSKPDIYAPGKDIISLIPKKSRWASEYPERMVGEDYFRLSGTSMAAPMVTGAVVLLLQNEPGLTPDQVKYRLINTAGALGSARYLDVYAAITGTTMESANTGVVASQLLWTGGDPITWNSVAWNSVAWNSVAWNSIAWNSVAWNSIAWNSVYWGR